jgi:hypothetical protein
VVSWGTYSCQCTTGWTGQLCTLPLSPCKIPNYCANNSTCVQLTNNTYVNENLAASGNYTCICQSGYIGYYCSASSNP